jgi:hypothetical protein
MGDKHIFTSKPYPLSNLLDEIENGDIALPDLQRPFVWKPTQIRDLFDSLFQGFPAGFILLWEITTEQRIKKIGTGDKKREPRFLVIDGQQRLTSLFSVIKNSEIINQKFETFKPKISFNPLEAKFEVWNPAIGKDIFWIDDISDFFVKTKDTTHSYITNFLENLKSKKEISNAEEEKITKNLEGLATVKSYLFTALELSSDIDTEMVSEIFVRVNSKGKPLNQSDFVMTVLSVYIPELRARIERFSLGAKTVPKSNKPSPYNNILQPDTDHLIRTIVAEAFSRGRLKYAHVLLKGRDPETRTESEETRKQNLDLFQEATDMTLNLTYWHDFVKILKNIGIVNKSLISSALTIYFTYAFYLHARKLQLDSQELEKFVGSWIYFSILSSRYIGSPETVFEEDIRSLRGKEEKDYFINRYEGIINSNLTQDFWKTTLPNNILISSSPRNPAHLSYLMVLNREDAKALFSETRIRDVLGGEEIYKKNLIDKHHIFPANYLKKKGLKNSEINQVANFCYLEYPLNIKISDKNPKDYFPKLLEKCTEKDLYYHAIPDKFWEMDYNNFLEARRHLIAKVIRDGVQKILID